MPEPLVYIIILNYLNYEDTIECVTSVEAIDYSNYHIIIVDNNSSNDSENILRKRFPHHTNIQTGENRGYAAGNNAGIKHALAAGADYIMILNNDTTVEPEFLTKMVAYAQDNPDVGVLGPKVVTESGEIDRACARRRATACDFFWRIGPGKWIFPKNKWMRAHYYLDEYDFQSAKKVDLISGSCMLIRIELFRDIGLFDETTFLFTEEAILHEKIRETKYATVVLPASQIIHKRQSSVNKFRYRAAWEFLKSISYYIRKYRSFGKVTTAFSIASVGFHLGVGVLRTYIVSNLNSNRKLTVINKSDKKGIQ